MSVAEIFRQLPNYVSMNIENHQVGTVRLEHRESEVSPDLNDDQIAVLSADASLQRSVAFYMHNNSPSLRAEFRVDGAVSAYFTWDELGQELIVEWGELCPDDDTKLHHFLNKAFDYRERAKEGMRTFSGHLARLRERETIVCLLDPIYNNCGLTEPLLSVVRRLQGNGFVVIGSDGGPVKNTVGDDALREFAPMMSDQ